LPDGAEPTVPHVLRLRLRAFTRHPTDRVARVSPGHYQRVSLSPVSAIADMVAPVVLMTLATIFANGLMTVGNTLTDGVLALDRERTGSLRGPYGEMLDEDIVPPADRERLRQIRDVTPLMIRRIERSRNAIVIIWIAVGLLVLSVAAIAVAVTANSEAFAFAALALVLAGLAGVFAGIATVIVSTARPTNSPVEAIKRMGVRD
jgi:polyferredoxin